MYKKIQTIHQQPHPAVQPQDQAHANKSPRSPHLLYNYATDNAVKRDFKVRMK